MELLIRYLLVSIIHLRTHLSYTLGIMFQDQVEQESTRERPFENGLVIKVGLIPLQARFNV